MDISTSRPIFLCLVVQSLWLVMLTWKSLWVTVLLTSILLVRLLYNKAVHVLYLLAVFTIISPIIIGLSGNRFFSIGNLQIVATFFMLLMLYRPLTKAFVQNIFVIHLFILGLFLYDQKSVFIFVLMFCDAVFVISLIFVCEQYPLSMSNIRELTGSMLKVLMQTIPFILVFYGLIPALTLQHQSRMDASFSGASFTHEVKPGKTDKLVLSDHPMFKAKFVDGELPIRDFFYWRTQIFSKANGLDWELSEDTTLLEAQTVDPGDNPRAIHYNVWVDKELYPIVPTLEYFAGVHKTENDRFLVDYAGVLKMIDIPSEQKPIALLGVVNPIYQQQNKQEANIVLKKEEALSTERINALVTKWKLASATPKEYFMEIAGFFESQNFKYSLSPGKMDSLDQFLFERKVGFCEHFAAATAYLFRLAGYQARVVAGFQGGEYAGEPGLWEITGKDAHAWLEVWSQKEGIWQRFDPILFVAPERLKWGGQRYFSLMERGKLASLLPDGLRAFMWQGLRRVQQWTYYIQSYGDRLIDEFIEYMKAVFTSLAMTAFLILLISSLLLIPILRSRVRIRVKILDTLFNVYLKSCLKSSPVHEVFFKDKLLQALKEQETQHIHLHQEFINAWLAARYDPCSDSGNWKLLLSSFLNLRKK